MSATESRTKLLRFAEFLDLSLTCVCFYLLWLSRTGEARTVWESLHPAFLPTLFITTSILAIILFTPEKNSHKLLLVTIHSILIHSLFSVILPAGDLSGQQMVLGRTRRVFDNTILHGLSGWPTSTISVFVLEALRGTNLQAVLSTVFARMLNVDILYVHLFLVPILWGAFVPLGSFLVTRELGGNETAAVLASLIVSAFPFSTYFGAISVPNSLGFIFFLYSVYFMLRLLSSPDWKTSCIILAFLLFSFLAHFLTGVMAASLFLLVLSFKIYFSEKTSLSAKAAFIGSFLVCLSLLPVSFLYLRFLGSTNYIAFTLDRLLEMPKQQIVGLIVLGELIYGFDFKTIVLMIVGPVLGLVCMIYLILETKRRREAELRTKVIFALTAFLIVLIDYRILKLFIEGLPINEERLWVFRDLLAAPFVAIAIVKVVSKLETLKVKFRATSVTSLTHISKTNRLRSLCLVLVIIVFIPALLGGWITLSLTAAYPQAAPLQTTWYELEAARHIEENTDEKYVVIGDLWTIYAGEVIVGIANPNAYYFQENSVLGHDLFANMSRDPSPQWMLSAMNLTKTQVAYFIITEPRLGAEEFNNIVTRIQTQQLTLFYTSQNEKLRVYSYRDST